MVIITAVPRVDAAAPSGLNFLDFARRRWLHRPPFGQNAAVFDDRQERFGGNGKYSFHRRAAGSKRREGLGETVLTVVYAILVALVIRTFLFEPFNIPSGSMVPTLLVGDYLFVSKYSYGYSKHSFPFSLGPFSGRIFMTPPKRGDVIVFKLPSDNKTDYIKRLIGLPGDTVRMQDGRLFINGQLVEREKIDDYTYRDEYGNCRSGSRNTKRRCPAAKCI